MKVTKAPKGRFGPFRPPPFLEIPARLSHDTLQNEESIVIHVDDEESRALPGKKERDYWNQVANKQLDRNGIVHLRTAEALLHLGDAHMRCEVSIKSVTMKGIQANAPFSHDINFL